MIKPLPSIEPSRLNDYGKQYVVFFHTPFCGTCAVAERMLDIVDQTLTGLTIYKCDANYTPDILRAWKVQSVPALAYVRDGQLTDIQFAFQGIDVLYNRLKAFTAA